MPPKRQLAAIMFADITGYTRMMQENEADGLRRLKRFREVLERSAAEHEGRVLQHIGDGSLAIFSSAVEAVTSAKEVQLALRTPPLTVPLRIGIHVGDIVVDDGQIYGDGVNLASRVESMGVPGGILITERVLPDLKSHPEFSAISLGHFNFKNVAAPMEVFAIAAEGIVVPRLQDLSNKPVKTERDKSITKIWVFGTIAALVLAVALYLLSDWLRAPASRAVTNEPSIAVLPFSDLNPEGDLSYFGDGIAEDILNALAQVEGLKVAGRTSSFSFREGTRDLKEIGSKLGVSTILEGSIRRGGERIRINAQLVDADNGYQLWSKRFDRDMGDIFAIQDEIALAVAQNLEVILMENGVEAGTDDQTAYEWYLKGQHMLSQRSDGVEQALDFFAKAIAIDANYANAYAGMGNAYLWLGWNNYMSSREAFSQARYYAREALRIDSSLAYAHAIKGSIDLWYEWDWETARQSLMQAITLNKNEARAYLDLGWLNAIAGEFEQGLSYVEKAIELDPLNLEYNIDLADIYRLSRNYNKAEEIASKIAQLHPQNSEVYWIKGMIAYSQKDGETAIAHFRDCVQLSEGDTWSTLHLAMALGAAGQQEEGQRLLEKLEQQPEISSSAMVEMVPVYWNLGQQDKALEWLEKGYRNHANWLISLKVAPEWDPLRQEARFQAIESAMRF